MYDTTSKKDRYLTELSTVNYAKQISYKTIYDTTSKRDIVLNSVWLNKQKRYLTKLSMVT